MPQIENDSNLLYLKVKRFIFENLTELKDLFESKNANIKA